MFCTIARFLICLYKYIYLLKNKLSRQHMNCFYVCTCVAFNIPLHQPNDIEINTNNNKSKRSEFINLIKLFITLMVLLTLLPEGKMWTVGKNASTHKQSNCALQVYRNMYMCVKKKTPATFWRKTTVNPLHHLYHSLLPVISLPAPPGQVHSLSLSKDRHTHGEQQK